MAMASDSEEIVYHPLAKAPTQFQPDEDDSEEEENPINLHEEKKFLIHLRPDDNSTQWDHVNDLDVFYTNIYEYFQGHGLLNIAVKEVFQVLQFIFIVVLVTYSGWCVNYTELFGDVPHNETFHKTLSDITYPVGTCISRFSLLTWFFLLLCFIVLVKLLWFLLYNLCKFNLTRKFFLGALNIETRELRNMTWHEVLQRLLEVQKVHRMCVTKKDVSPLDVYNRILRYKNFFVAMVNKEVYPLKFRIPFIGQYAILTQQMKFCIDFLVHSGCDSVYADRFYVHQEYKSSKYRDILTIRMRKKIALMAFVNLFLSPVIFFYQIIYFILRYTESFKHSPGSFNTWQWSNYGRIYLRHFNELEHELNARLNRAYAPAQMYMNSFTSPTITVVAKYTAFFFGSITGVMFLLTLIDFNDLIKVENFVLIATVCGFVARASSSFIPNENEVFCPERLMNSIVAQIAYIPDHWNGRAHTTHVRDEFAMLFQYKLIGIIEELLSPLITPFWLYFSLRPRSAQMVDFFRCFTIAVDQNGDMCSFAQMDLKKHGDPEWRMQFPTSGHRSDRNMQAQNGKTEKSLLHFIATNPEWKSTYESNNFIEGVKSGVKRDIHTLTSMLADPINLPSLAYINPMVSIYPMGSSMHLNSPSLQNPAGSPFNNQTPKLRGNLSAHDGPLVNVQSSLSNSESFHSATYSLAGGLDEGHLEHLSTNMSLSVLHLHEAHHRQRLMNSRAYFLELDDASGVELNEASSSPPLPKPQSTLPHRQQLQTHFSYGQSSRPSRPVDDDTQPFSSLFQQPTSQGGHTPYPSEEPSAPYTQRPHGIFSNDDSESASLQPARGAFVTHMPKIREDSVEHEIDTSK